MVVSRAKLILDDAVIKPADGARLLPGRTEKKWIDFWFETVSYTVTF